MSIYLRGGRTKMPAKSPMIFAIVSIKLTHVGFRAHVKIASLVSLLRPSQSGAGRCDERVCLSVCLFVYVPVCSLILGTTCRNIAEFSAARYLWPWLGSPLAASGYGMYFLLRHRV